MVIDMSLFMKQCKTICEMYFEDNERFNKSRHLIQNDIMMEVITLHEQNKLENVNFSLYSDKFRMCYEIFKHYQPK